jgi:membrane protein implicated in regulation of membrane protease activity
MSSINILVLGMVLMIMAYVFRRPALAIIDSVIWLMFGIYSLSLSVATWDIYYGLFVVGVAMFLVAIFEGFILRPRRSQTEPEEEFWDSEADDYAKRRAEFRGKIGTITDRNKEITYKYNSYTKDELNRRVKNTDKLMED